jgi:hypothetical protein
MTAVQERWRDLLRKRENRTVRICHKNVLVENPERGDVIKGGGGIRKLRHALPGRGKSSGVRVIYYWLRDDGKI